MVINLIKNNGLKIYLKNIHIRLKVSKKHCYQSGAKTDHKSGNVGGVQKQPSWPS